MKTALAPVSQSFKVAYARFGNAPFLFVLFGIFALYALINGSALFPNWGSGNTELILTYGFMVLIYLVWAKRRTEAELRTPVNKAAFSFVGFFFFTWILLEGAIVAGLITVPTDFPNDMFWQVVLIQICVVALAEELMFRGIMLSYFGNFIQAVLFALWHSYAYQIRWYNISFESMGWVVPLIVAFIMAILLGYVARNKQWGGLPATIAIHACYNLVIIGAFSVTI